MPRATCSHGTRPARPIPSVTNARADSLVARPPASPPSSATRADDPPFSSRSSAVAERTRQAHSIAWAKLTAPTGRTSTSWMSRARRAWAPPETTLTIGKGSSGLFPPSNTCQRGHPKPRAPAIVTATDSASTEFAPRRPSAGVPSSASMTASTPARSVASIPITAGARTSLRLRTALLTPNPPKRSPPSRNSRAL